MNAPLVRPPSASNIWLTSSSALLLVVVLLWLLSADYEPMTVLIACLLAIAVPIASVDLLWNKVHQRASAGLDGSGDEPLSQRLPRVAVKLLGLWLTLSIIILAYWILPEYSGDFYGPFYELVSLVGPIFALGAIPYFFYVDRLMKDPYDGYWLSGQMLLGRMPDTEGELQKLKHHALGWIIKAFFLPLMTVFLLENIHWLSENGIARAVTPDSFGWWLRLAFFLDVAFGMIGYLATLRLLDTHIRSANPLVLGWVVALICYPPFWNLMEAQYLRYSGSENWEFWLSGTPLLYTVWAVVMLALVFIYSWSTVAFGLRFSNLTHRGIITDGPYALTKHPAYICKNLFWWMSAMPFLATNGWQFAIKGCLLLGLVNMIYFLRARTEERHLMEDPVYVAYADWIREHGLIARLTSGSRSPALRTPG
jgi:protein-S-isoprenylcysteine O-methyltransferase Ste14